MWVQGGCFGEICPEGRLGYTVNGLNEPSILLLFLALVEVLFDNCLTSGHMLLGDNFGTGLK